MTTDKRDTGLSLELETHDDAAFEEIALDEELEDAAPIAQPRRSKSKVKLLAGVLVLGVLGAGGYVAYQQTLNGGVAAPVAAIPSDVPVDMAGGDVLTPPGIDPFAPPVVADGVTGVDPLQAAPFDPNAPVGGMADGALPGAEGMIPPQAPAAPDAVLADGVVPAPVPMPGFDPMAALPPAEPMQPAPIDPTTGLVPPADPAGVPASVPSDPFAPAPIDPALAAAPVEPVIPPASPAPVIDPVIPAQAAPVPPAHVAAPAAPAVDQAAADAMHKQITTLENRVVQLEGELRALRDRPVPAAAPAASGVTDAEFQALSRRIDELAAANERAATARAAAPAPVAAAPAPVAAPRVTTPQVVPATVRATTRVEQATSSAPVAPAVPATINAPSPAPAIAAPTPLSARPSAAPAKGVNWQLRSAQPGRAWLAQPGTQEMRSVAVGDEVPGLGRILSISQGADSRWSVRGSMGSVTQ